MNNDDISHFSTIPASFAIKSQYLLLARTSISLCTCLCGTHGGAAGQRGETFQTRRPDKNNRNVPYKRICGAKLITANHSAPCPYLCAQFYGYILLADETVVFYKWDSSRMCGKQRNFYPPVFLDFSMAIWWMYYLLTQPVAPPRAAPPTGRVLACRTNTFWSRVHRVILLLNYFTI